MELSVVIGVFNEQDIVASSLAALHRVLCASKIDFEIILVNDGSTDATAQAIADIALDRIRVISYVQNCGKGYAVKQGVLAAVGDYVLFTDIDLAYPPEQIPIFLRRIKELHADGVIGSRMLNESSFIVTVNAFKSLHLRYLTSRAFNFLARTFFGISAHDTQSGIKCFKRQLLQKFVSLQKINGFAFDVELLLMASLSKSRVIEIPVTVVNATRRSKVRVFKHSLQMFKDLLRVKWYQLHGTYRSCVL